MVDDLDKELIPDEVPGFKVGQKKTIDEYTKLDANDESLNKWKKSLGLNLGEPLKVAPGDKRTVVIVSMTLKIRGQEPVVINLENEDSSSLKDKKIKFQIKENSVYHLIIRFKIQHDIITGLRYLQGVKKARITVDRIDEPLGSYAPNTVDKPYYEKVFQEIEAPSGILARGSYSALSKFIDDDKVTHMTLPWAFHITK
ncbi:DEKNAAC104799 [Brettanomyces naardenensis]|uniref:DEKNAAC104799 n=1 Tax=Brettanomyces naardenensis TaxID=13370 RepID=A0A448YSF9_BRENA|nr:DEKNAAC104799 [Brettanomyces naardenensis]